MKTILRNFISVIRRFKMATILNIMGLSVAFAAFIIILIQVNYERSFDKFHTNADRIYRLEGSYFGYQNSTIHPRPIIDEFIKSSPHIVTGTLAFPLQGEVYLSVGSKDAERGFKEEVCPCYPEITDVFDLKMIEGNRKALEIPGQAIIPESMAEKIFPGGSALDKTLYANENPVNSIKSE